MSSIVIGLIALYIVGTLVLAGLYLNDVRRVYNNFIPGALQTAPIKWLGADSSLLWLSLHFRFSRIDPDLLTEIGRTHRNRAIRHERLIFAWFICGFIVIGYFAR